jgi:hypothetical protein
VDSPSSSNESSSETGFDSNKRAVRFGQNFIKTIMIKEPAEKQRKRMSFGKTKSVIITKQDGESY